MYSATSAREMPPAAGQRVARLGAVLAAGRAVRERSRHAHDRPVQLALAHAGLHAPQVGVGGPEEERLDDPLEDPRQVGVAPGLGAAGGEDDEAAHCVALHGADHVERAEALTGGLVLAVRRAERDEHGVLAVDGVADHAAVEDVAGDHADPAGEVAELLRGADQRGHVVTALQRALRQQPPGAAGRSDDEHLHAPHRTRARALARPRAGRHRRCPAAGARNAGVASRGRRLWAVERPPPALSGSMRTWAPTWRAESSSSRGRASASGARSRCASPPPAAGWRSPTSSIAPRPRRSRSAAAASALPTSSPSRCSSPTTTACARCSRRVVDHFGCRRHPREQRRA